MSALRILNSGEWNIDPVLLAARRLVFVALGAQFDVVALGDVATFLNGTSYDKAHVHPTGTTPIIRISNISDPSSQYLRTDEELPNRFVVAPDDLLVSWSASFKSIIWPGPAGYLNQHIFKVTERDGFDRHFIRHAIEASFEKMQESVVGIGMMHLRRDAFLSHPIPRVPITLQRHVAKYLDAVEIGGPRPDRALLPTLPGVISLVERIEAIAGKVEEARRLRGEAEKEAEALSYAFLRQVRQRLLSLSIPKARLGSVTRVTAGGTPSRDNAANWDGDIPWIKTGELLDGDILNAEEKITQVGVDNSSAKLFPPDTVLIALYGQGQTRGRTGRLLIPATTNQACCAVLPQPELLDPLFVQFWLRSLYVELREQAQGGAQPNWNSAMIKNLEIAIPLLDEQRGIVAELGALRAHVDAFEGLQAETRVGLDAMVPAVLDMAFRGEM